MMTMKMAMHGTTTSTTIHTQFLSTHTKRHRTHTHTHKHRHKRAAYDRHNENNKRVCTNLHFFFSSLTFVLSPLDTYTHTQIHYKLSTLAFYEFGSYIYICMYMVVMMMMMMRKLVDIHIRVITIIIVSIIFSYKLNQIRILKVSLYFAYMTLASIINTTITKISLFTLKILLFIFFF